MSKGQLKAQLILAGAGSGKTRALIAEVYKLFQEFRKAEQRDPKLIVCTFTRKASQELKERLFEKALAEQKKESIFKSKKPNREKAYLKTEAPLQNSSLFLNYIQSPSLHISTIDGILHLFLKRYGYGLNLSPDFQLYSSQVNERIFDSMAQSFLFEEPSSLLKKMPYYYLKKLFLFYFNCRLKYGEVSFYNKEDFEDFQKDQMLFLRIKESLRGKKNKQEVVFDYFLKEQNRFLKVFLFEGLNLKEIEDFFKEEEAFHADHFVPLFEEFKAVAEKLFPLFLEKKKSGGLLNMEDLFLFSLVLLRDKPQIADFFSREWDYWLIDEYQDTSWMQEQIIKRITGFQNVFCVGDPGQSIYLFRSADPKVFQRREEALKGDLKKRDTNYRSSPELVHFYNDFFPEEEGFIKCKPRETSSIGKEDAEQSKSSPSPFRESSIEKKENALKEANKKPAIGKEDPSIYFLTYDRENKERYSSQTLKALQFYIQKQKAKACSYSDIAILSRTNEDLDQIALFLRKQGFPLNLYSSKNFAQKRLIRDALFLLKFLSNPFDNTNLKALLRTPYFRLSDQELANNSWEHHQLETAMPFWSFIKNKLSDKPCISSLSLFLEEKKTKGLVKTFEKALMSSGLLEFSYFQDPTGSSEANLWKSLYLLNRECDSPLELFYSLQEESQEEFDVAEAPSAEGGEALKMMTIHKSKGLEFEHVILMDSSMGLSSLRSQGSEKASLIYDETRNQMAFAVPIGGREKRKVKSYAHKLYNRQKAVENLEEKNRVFYVAFTRAKKSLTFFIPNSLPEKNSWLREASFFKKPCFHSEESKQNLLELEYDLKDKNKVKSWRLNEGLYKTKFYSFRVQSVDSIYPSFDLSADFKKERPKKSLALAGRRQKYLEAPSPITRLSSKDFVNGGEAKSSLSANKSESFAFKPLKDKKAQQAKIKNLSHSNSFFDPFLKEEQSFLSFYREKNILFKTRLGSRLHFFLQKLSSQNLWQIQELVENSFLLRTEKKKIQEALLYVDKLKKPPLKLFLKKGFSEWPFQLKRRGIIFQGQIDLWAWDNKGIQIFDYKSSEACPDQTKKQLIFYSWILNELYHPEKIQMSAVYPFQKKINSFLYGKAEKSLFEKWLEF